MPLKRRLTPFLVLAILLALPRTAPFRGVAQSGELPAVAPKEAGFSSERLAALDISLKNYMPNLQDLSRTLVQQALIAP
jgi:hypothetical protein